MNISESAFYMKSQSLRNLPSDLFLCVSACETLWSALSLNKRPELSYGSSTIFFSSFSHWQQPSASPSGSISTSASAHNQEDFYVFTNLKLLQQNHNSQCDLNHFNVLKLLLFKFRALFLFFVISTRNGQNMDGLKSINKCAFNI